MDISTTNKFELTMADVILAGVGLGIIILLLWLPSGFKGGDIREHWFIRDFVDTGTANYDSQLENSLIKLALTRPIARVLYWTAYFIDPDSFRGDNILAMTILWGKGIALFILMVRLFPARRVFAFLFAVIFVIYPGDPGVLSLRIPHIHFSILAYLIATNMLILHWRLPRRRYLVGMWVAVGLSGLAYEAIYPLIFLTPGILWLLEQKLSRRLIRATVLWWIIPVITFMYSMVLIFILNYGFQAKTVINDVTLLTTIKLIASRYDIIFTDAWTTSLYIFSKQLNPVMQYSAVACGGVAAVVALIFMKRNKQPSTRLGIVNTLVLLSIGLVVVFTGYIMYALTNRAEENYRVFLIGSLGAALCLSVIAYESTHILFRRYAMYVFILGMSAAIGIGSAYHLTYRMKYVHLTDKMYHFFSQILSQVPDVNTHHINYIFFATDGSFNYKVVGVHKPHLLTAALHNIYHDAQRVHSALFCTRPEKCTGTPEGIQVTFQTGQTQFYPYEKTLIFEIEDNGTVHLLESFFDAETYNPYAIIDSEAAKPMRLESLLH